MDNRPEKFIRVTWVPEHEWGYRKAMRVVESDHPIFIVGSRFDYGFLNIAVDTGYEVHIDAVPESVHRAETASLRGQGGEKREEQKTIPCPDGKPGCLVLHFATPVPRDEGSL